MPADHPSLDAQHLDPGRIHRTSLLAARAVRTLGLSHRGKDAAAHPYPLRPPGLEDNPMSSVTSVSPRTLGDVIPGGLVRSIALVIGGAIFVGLTAQVSIPLPFTPVPLTLQTFSVLLVGAALGSVRGVASMALYLLAGVAGVPWFAEHQSGWALASFGYIVGFVAAAWVVGRLAERGADRRVLPTIGMMALGNLVIYVFGVAGLMLIAHLSVGKALALGVLPFLIGDAIKILLAAVLLPGTWKLINSRKDS
jgi:biotin transport system substrate-specific component